MGPAAEVEAVDDRPTTTLPGKPQVAIPPPLPPLPSTALKDNGDVGGMPSLPPLPSTARKDNGDADGMPSLPPLPPLPTTARKDNGDVGGVPSLPPLPSTALKDNGDVGGMPSLPPLPSTARKDNGDVGGMPSLPPLPPLPTTARKDNGDVGGVPSLPPLPSTELKDNGGASSSAEEVDGPSSLPSLSPLPSEAEVDAMNGVQSRQYYPTHHQGSRPSLHEERDPWEDNPDRDLAIDYLSVRLQSPSEIRKLAKVEGNATTVVTTAREENGQILHPYDFADLEGSWEVVPDGLYCERIFGRKMTYKRRNKPGYIELSWPASHVWFSGNGKLGKAACMLGCKASSIFSVRRYTNDIFLGEWVAPRLGPLMDPVTKGPKVAGIGSPVAAAEAPVLKHFRLQDEDDAEIVKEELGSLSREEYTIGQLLKAACCELPADAAWKRETAQRVLVAVQSPAFSGVDVRVIARAISLGRELPWMVEQFDKILQSSQETGSTTPGFDAVEVENIPRHELEDILQSFQDGQGQSEPASTPVDGREELLDTAGGPETSTRTPRSVLVCMALESLKELGLSAEQAVELLLAGLSPEATPNPDCSRFQKAAQEDFYQFWRSLATPNFDGDLEATLDNVLTALRGQVKLEDAAKAGATCKTLLNQFLVALDLASRALTATPEDQESMGGGSRLSRYRAKEREVCWYDTGMAPAAFHLQDVERLAESDLPSAFATVSSDAATSSQVKMENGVAHPQIEASSTKGLTTPTKHKKKMPFTKRSNKAAIFYRHQAQKATSRWHLPMQDATRPGCAGGMRPLCKGQVIPSTPTSWAQYAVTRPRPCATATSIPGNMEAEGCLYVGSGGAAIRQVLCDVEPAATLQRLVWDISRLDGAQKACETPGARLNLTLQRAERLEKRFGASAESRSKELLDRRDMMESVVAKHQLPEWCVLTSFPVLAPDLRTRSASQEGPEDNPDDVQMLYKDVIQACRELEICIAERESAGLLRYRKFMVQVAVDNVIDNGRMNKAKEKSTGTPFESVAKRLKGKQGRMRKNMLGKRVDYSARTVIVVEPKLEMDECGLPFEIAKDIYLPFLEHEIKIENNMDIHETSAGSRDLMDWYWEQPKELQWHLLERAMGDRLVLLNRAPTLHRLSLQAFRPKLIEGKALKIPPLVCSPFNADFDGDTMTIHLTLSKEATEEAEALMMPSRNLSSPADGGPVIGPTQDMVLGLYFMTSKGSTEQPEVCQTIQTADELASVAAKCAVGDVPQHQELLVSREMLMELIPEDDTLAGEEDEIRTTAGRVLFFLNMHRGFHPPMRHSADLLDDLDTVPLA